MEPSPAQIHMLARVSACVALRDEAKLKLELKKALPKIPVTVIREVILQTYLFAGYASTINAFIVLNEMTSSPQFAFDPDASMQSWRERGEELCRKIYDDQYEKLVLNMNALHPDLADWMVWEGYGKVLSRPFLSPRVRELLIVAMTAILGVERQFHSHVRGAMNVGATGREIKAILREIQTLMSKREYAKFTELTLRLCGKS